jgi:hypothetical protein
MAGRTIAFNDTAVRAAKYLGKGTETEYRFEGNPGLVLIVQAPNRANVSTRGWRFYYNSTTGDRVMARRLIMIVKALYNFVLFDRPSIAARYGIDTNPADRLGRRRQGSSGGYGASAPRERSLDNGEIVQWWRALNLSAMRTDTRIALKLVLATAQRPGEVRRARRADLHLAFEEEQA